MENTPLLLWWEIAFFLFLFENFIADLARPGSKSKLGFSVLSQCWLHIGISHCFWNQPEKMSLCREQGEMCQQSRAGERLLALSSPPQVLPRGSILLGKEEAWCHSKPTQRWQGATETATERKKGRLTNVTWGGARLLLAPAARQAEQWSEREQLPADVWQRSTKEPWHGGDEGGRDGLWGQSGRSPLSGGCQEGVLQPQPALGGMTWVRLLWETPSPTKTPLLHLSSFQPWGAVTLRLLGRAPEAKVPFGCRAVAQ